MRGLVTVLLVAGLVKAPLVAQGCSGYSEPSGAYPGCKARNDRIVRHDGNDALLRVGNATHELLGYAQVPGLAGVALVGPRPLDILLPGTGCRLVTDHVWIGGGVSSGPEGTTRVPLPMPALAELGGQSFLSQFVWLDPLGNLLGLTTSRGLRQWIGRASGECWRRLETVRVGDCDVDLCQRDDGAFGLGRVQCAGVDLRRTDSLVVWEIAGRYPRLLRRDGLVVHLQEPTASLTFAPEERSTAGTTFRGLSILLETATGPIVERATWEVGGSTRGVVYFDGYRGWASPPAWQQADAVPPTNPKLLPSLLHGTGFQFQQGAAGALVHFHTSPGDRLVNESKGEALSFESTFHGPTKVQRYLLHAPPLDSAVNLWTRAHEVVYREIGQALGLPKRTPRPLCLWPSFMNGNFADTARKLASRTAQEGFSGVMIDTIWDNATFHGGKKNLLTWDYVVCPGYGGEAGLASLVAECQRNGLAILGWLPACHLDPLSPVWKSNPSWVLRDDIGNVWLNPSGLWHGDLATGFHDYFRDRVVNAVKKFGFAGLWSDSHLAYAGQTPKRPNSTKLAALYGDLIAAGAHELQAEGDASAIASYAIAIDETWPKIPPPDLFYGATLVGWSIDPRVWAHFRAYVAGGAPWSVSADFLWNDKLQGPEIEAARREIRQVLRDWAGVRHLMVHRFARPDGSGWDWTNDADRRVVTWLLADSKLRGGGQGHAGKVYVIESEQ